MTMMIRKPCFDNVILATKSGSSVLFGFCKNKQSSLKLTYKIFSALDKNHSCQHVVEICDESEAIWYEIGEAIYNAWLPTVPTSLYFVFQDYFLES